MTHRRGFVPLMNDISGVQFPFDYSAQGTEAFVTLKLTRWNENILQGIQDTLGGTGLGGIDPTGTIGTLMGFENYAFNLWLMYSYGPGMIAPHGAMLSEPPGYHFWLAFLDQEASYEGGTDPASVTLTFHCMRKYNPADGSLTLFDTNMTAARLATID